MKQTSTATTTPNVVDIKSKSETTNPYCDLTPHRQAVGEEIFDDIVADLQRYLFISEEEAIKATFWTAHANIFSTFEYSPILVITAPMKNCGKTILLSVLNRMTNHSLHGDNMTPSAFFRLANKGDTSFFFDEADMWFGKKRNSDKENEMTAALNGGRTEDGSFWRNVGDGKGDFVQVPYRTHSAVALAGIQLQTRLHDSTMDRSLVVQMRRAMPNQLDQRFRRRKHLPIFQKHGERLLRWCNDHKEQLKSHEPNIPDEVDGRDEDKWYSLISVAQLVSPAWGNKLLNILQRQTPPDANDVVIQLLRDCRRLLDGQFNGVKAIRPAELAIALGGLPDAEDSSWHPWSRYHADKYHEQDARIKSRDVSALLGLVGVRKRTVRMDDGKPDTALMSGEIRSAQETYAPMPKHYEPEEYIPGLDSEDGNGSWISDYVNHSEEVIEDAIPF